jgi:regulator of replication initiation timing
MYNAIHEGGPKNGVLTAVEDFMMETDEPMHFHSVPAFHGYGILVSEQRLAICPGLRISFSDLLPPQNLRCLIASLEQSRVKATAADLAQKSQALVKASEQAKQKSFLDRENTQLKQVITLRDRALAETKTAISELSKEKSSLERSNAKLNQTVAQRDIALTKKDAAIAEKDRAIRRYRDELYSVYTSRSWRVTAPMRKIGTFVRRVTSLAHRPRIRGMIKQVYFLLPGFMRNSHRVQSLKNRFKSKEL